MPRSGRSVTRPTGTGGGPGRTAKRRAVNQCASTINASTIAKRAPRDVSLTAQPSPPNPHRAATTTGATGTAARIAGEYIASTRDAGIPNRPAPFSRSV